MKLIIFFSGFLLSLSSWALEAPQTPTEDSPTDTTIMGGNTPGYNQEPTQEQEIEREQEIKKDEKELIKQQHKKLETNKSY